MRIMDFRPNYQKQGKDAIFRKVPSTTSNNEQLTSNLEILKV